MGQSYHPVGIRPGGPVGEPPGCSAASLASDAAGRKSRKQRALKAEGLQRWGRSPRAGPLLPEKGSGLGLTGEVSRGSSYQASGILPGILEFQCFTVFQVGASWYSDAHPGPCARQTGRIRTLVGMQEPGVSADLCQSVDRSPLLLSAYPPHFLPEQHFQSCREADTA